MISVVTPVSVSRRVYKNTLALLARRATTCKLFVLESGSFVSGRCRLLVVWAGERGFCGRALPHVRFGLEDEIFVGGLCRVPQRESLYLSGYF